MKDNVVVVYKNRFERDYGGHIQTLKHSCCQRTVYCLYAFLLVWK